MSERIYYSREAELRAQRDRLFLSVIVTGFGIGIGAVVALLLAPRAGDETRRQVGDSMGQATSQGLEVAGQVLKTVVDGASKLQEEMNGRLQSVVNQ